MKLKILNLDKTEIKSVELPRQFHEPLRIDIIKRAFLSIRSNNRQPYGANPKAGLRASAELSRRRRKYRGSYGAGISRVPRKIMSRRGTRMNWVGAVAPGTVGGRRAHPPKAEKLWSQKINNTERRKAIRSALSATMDVELVKNRGHNPPNTYPFVITDDINKINQTKKLTETLSKIGFKEELEEAKSRGRKGLLLVTASKELKKACSNIPGFETEKVSNLNVNILAPGGVPGRLTLFTQSAINELSEVNLFTKTYKGKSGKKNKNDESTSKLIVKEKPKLKIAPKESKTKKPSKSTKKQTKK